MYRVAVTGVGAVAPCGLDAESAWQSALAGRSGIAGIRSFDPSGFSSRVAGECLGFDPTKYMERRRMREGARFIHFGLAASQMAIEHASFDPNPEDRMATGCYVGVGMCGLELIEKYTLVVEERGPRKISPYFVPASISNLAPGQISIRWGFGGPNFATSSACASGAHAIGMAYRSIQVGESVAAIAGGAEAAVTPLGVGGFCALRSLSTRNDAPDTASRPFDRDRDGFVIAEGAGMLMLERWDYAEQRGATILAELTGYAATSDAHHITQPAPDSRGAVRAMEGALRDAGLSAGQVDYVNAHGTSTPYGDLHELQALNAVFRKTGNAGPAISSTKGVTGHLLGAAGGLEAVFCVQSLRDQRVAPTANLQNPDPNGEGLRLVRGHALDGRFDVAMSNSFGFGGTNVSLVFRRR